MPLLWKRIMYQTPRWLVPLTIVALAAAPVWAGVAVVGAPSGGFAGGLYATDGGGNPIDTASPAPDEFASISDADVTGAPLGGMGAHFTFGPDASFERNDGAAAIQYFDDLPLKSVSSFGNSSDALGAGSKGSLPTATQFSSGGAGGGLLITHVLPPAATSNMASSNAWQGQSFMQGGGNSSPNPEANHSIQLASLALAANGAGPMVASNSIAGNSLSDRMVSTLASGGETTGFFTSGTWGVVQNVSTALPSPVVMDHAALTVSGMAPEPGSLAVWGLLGLVFGGAGWRHRRRLLALA